MESKKLSTQEKLRGELQEPRHDGKIEEKMSSAEDAAAAAGSSGRASGRGGAQNVSNVKDAATAVGSPAGERQDGWTLRMFSRL